MMERDPFVRTDTPLRPEKDGASPRALIMSGYGINSEMETVEALKMAGMASDIVHINDLIADVTALTHYRLLVFPGGFSYGDDTGAGNAFANRIRNNLKSALDEFLAGDNLVLGICNGFQILAHLGLVPGFDALHTRDIALMPNRKGVLECRFVTLKPESDTLWTRGLPLLFCPVAHGEGTSPVQTGPSGGSKRKAWSRSATRGRTELPLMSPIPGIRTVRSLISRGSPLRTEKSWDSCPIPNGPSNL